MHYFRLPKLGAYLAVPLIYNSFLSEEVFDAAYKARKDYLDQLDEFKKQQDEDVKQMEAELEESEKKLEDMTEKNAEEAATDPLQEEVKELKEKLQTRMAETLDES